MRIRLSIPDRLVTPEALEAALEATSLANEQAILNGEIPSLTEAIKKGVRWKPEPFLDGEHFDLAHQVVARNWGDCDDLAPWLTGELRASGQDPGARSRVYKSGPDRWHVVTETSDGEILDPSRWAGMGRKKSSVSGVGGIHGVHAVTARPFARTGEGALCCVPHKGQYWSRVDLPFPDAHGHIASHARSRSPEESLYKAIAGAIACGEQIDSDLVDRARMMGAMLLGDLTQVSGEEVGFLGKLLKQAVPFAASFIPGVGPIVSKVTEAGLNMAEKAMAKKPKPAAAPKATAPKAEPQTLVRALSKGGGAPKPTPDTVTHKPSGAVSVPLAVPPASAPPAMLYYHPSNAAGPVVMRF